MLQNIYNVRRNEVCALVCRPFIQHGHSLGPDERWKNIQPSIELINLINSNIDTFPFRQWYSTQRSDIKWAMIAIQHALERYADEDKGYLDEALSMGRRLDGRFSSH